MIPRRGEERLLAGLRLTLALGTGALLLVTGLTWTNYAAAALLLAIAAVASAPLRWLPMAETYRAPVESIAACCVMLSVEPLPEALLPYLLAPALAAGLIGGVRVAVTAAGLSGATLLIGRALGEESRELTDYLATVSQWTLITLAVGLLGAWILRLQHEGKPAENAAYESAYRLISQLRLVARQLSGGLDPVSIAHGLLKDLQTTHPFEKGAVYVRSTGGRLTPIAFAGAERIAWSTEHPLFAEAWASSLPVQASAPWSPETTGFGAVLPLRVGMRTIGLVALESRDGGFDLDGADAQLEGPSLRLETALLFSEVREMATAEERRRLAREIHDGIAQELASLGYTVDDLAARARFLPELETDLKGLRGELTRVISELRLSMFDLRSEVQSTIGLGTAVSDYVRQVGAGSNLVVHLILDEAPVRLPVAEETELLRIVQEAVTNARKHARAANLWVTCRVDPPSAYILVEDDGTGLGHGRHDSFGLEVMRERASKIGAQVSVHNRAEQGTAVEVTLRTAGVASNLAP